MRIVMTNPRVAAVHRRCHTTVVVLQERGYEIELLYTSLAALDALAEDMAAGVDAALDGQAGTEWHNPKCAVRTRRSDEISDLLYDAGLLERPAFMRRSKSVSTPRGEGARVQRIESVAGSNDPKPKAKSE
jgi:hypothetical protein